MIKYSLFGEKPFGELYVEHIKSKSKGSSINSFFSTDPCADYCPDDGIDIKIKNFSDLITFLNYDESALTKGIQLLALKSLDYAEDINTDLIQTLKADLAALHTFFKVNTEYHLYDLVIREVILLLHPYTVSLHNEEDIPNCFEQIQKRLIKLIFNMPDYPDYLIPFYNKIFECKNTMRIYEWVPSNPFSEIFEIRDFIRNEIPLKKFSLEDPEFQVILTKLYLKYGIVTTLSPFSLTNHAKRRYLEQYKYLKSTLGFPSTSFEDIFKTAAISLYEQENEPQNQTYKNIPVTHEITKDLNELFRESNNQAIYTYPIYSFSQYIVAELHSLFTLKIAFKRCETCARFYIFDHPCSYNIDTVTLNQLKKKYRNIINSINNSLNQNYNGQCSIKGCTDYDLYHYYFEQFRNYHDKVYHQALFHQVPYTVYKQFVDHPRCSVKAMENNVKRLQKLNAIEIKYRGQIPHQHKLCFQKKAALHYKYSSYLPDFQEYISLYKEYKERSKSFHR